MIKQLALQDIDQSLPLIDIFLQIDIFKGQEVWVFAAASNLHPSCLISCKTQLHCIVATIVLWHDKS